MTLRRKALESSVAITRQAFDMSTRLEGRAQMRSPGKHYAALHEAPEGSVLIDVAIRAFCARQRRRGVPAFLRAKQGLAPAEYGMLPRSTNTARGASGRRQQSGRTQEIQRLIGRSLRAVVDLTALGERTIRIDCDVLQRTAAPRCASITGACVAVADAIAWCAAKKTAHEKSVA